MTERVNEEWDNFHEFFSDVLGEKENDELSIHISQIGDQLKSNK